MHRTCSKPALARGELHCIGATTLDEYQKHIEKDAALERRFQPVFVNEPSVEDTIAILRGLKERYEMHHGVRITDTAIVPPPFCRSDTSPIACCPIRRSTWSTKRRAAWHGDGSYSKEIDEVERHMLQLKIEKEALLKEDDKTSKAKLEKIAGIGRAPGTKQRHEGSLAEKKEKVIAKIRELKEKIESAKTEEQNAERKGDLTKAAKLTYGVIPGLKGIEEDKISNSRVS